MNRRSFLSTGGAGLLASAAFNGQASAAQGAARPYYEFRIYRMQIGPQTGRMNSWAESRLMPLLKKHGFGPVGFFSESVGPNVPSLYGLLSYASLAEREKLWGSVAADPDWRKAVDELEAGHGPPFYRADGWLLQATDYSPEFKAVSGPRGRIYELRIYESPTEKQLRALNERFAGPEIPIFHRSGIHPVLYAETAIGPDMPNLTYLTPFDSLAQREQAWRAFRRDPEWPKARDESIARSGEIVRNITAILLSPTGYSMLR